MGRLFWKFFLSILLAQLAATIGIGSIFWLREQARQLNGAEAIDNSPPAEFLLDSAAIAMRYGGLPALRELVAAMRRHTVIVLDERGRDLVGRTVPAHLRVQAEQARTGSQPCCAVRTLAAADGQHYLVFVPRAYRAAHTAASGGEALPVVPVGPPQLFGRHIGRRAPVIAATLASLLFAALLALYFSRRIRALRSAFQAAAAGDLAPRFGPRSGRGDELSDLGHEFDRMSGQLRALMEGQRRLLHDVSHELRSPLARLQAAIGLAHQQPDKIGASLARIELESARIDKLVGELLTLTRLEGLAAHSMNEVVDIGEMAGQIAADARFEAGPDGPCITTYGKGNASVRGAPDLLWRAIENVVRNAARHGGDGGVVDIVVRAAGPWLHVEVLDRGRGIDAAELPSIFEPFFRSRRSANSIDGYGLGLPIAQRVAEAHGGRIAIRNRAGGGLRVTIMLPLLAEDDPAGS